MYGSDVNAACRAGDGCSTASEHPVAERELPPVSDVEKLSET
jgi:hypothetical protein